MRLTFIIFYGILLLYACNHKHESKAMQIVDETNEHIPKDTSSLFFPLDTFHFTSDSNNRTADSSIKLRYSEILFRLKEPVLYNYSGKQEIVRFLWIRPFDNPVVVRVNNLEGTIFANIKEVEPQYYNDINFVYKIGIDTIVKIDSSKWNKIISSLQSEGFWNSRTARSYDYEDATFCIIEGFINNRYHCITRTVEDSFSLDNVGFVKELYAIGNSILPMKNRREEK